MKKKTVRNRILYSNALMVIVTLLLFLVINLAVAQNDLYAPPDGAACPSMPLADLPVGHTLKEV